MTTALRVRGHSPIKAFTPTKSLVQWPAPYQGDHRRPDGTGWATLHDPEGNEFCVQRSAGAGERLMSCCSVAPVRSGAA
ncbi:hypothetical protein AB0C81_09485 [Streptomyces roseoverticillatus]|uniref:hypothetical protein n=1 Tax=Streptomyces roseoverticillatus TaxID=66429 RepID=UPI0033CCE1A9